MRSYNEKIVFYVETLKIIHINKDTENVFVPSKSDIILNILTKYSSHRDETAYMQQGQIYIEKFFLWLEYKFSTKYVEFPSYIVCKMGIFFD